MDWKRWIPKERATLCFIVEGSRVLLIRKLRGLGAGKVNGPGGKIEPGETPEACAIRETQEEVGVTPRDLRLAAELSFQFADGYSLFCSVFIAANHEGEPYATAEAEPFWVEKAAIPFDEMWQDDRWWLHRVLAGETLRGFFEFDGDRMDSFSVEALCGVVAEQNPV